MFDTNVYADYPNVAVTIVGLISRLTLQERLCVVHCETYENKDTLCGMLELQHEEHYVIGNNIYCDANVIRYFERVDWLHDGMTPHYL